MRREYARLDQEIQGEDYGLLLQQLKEKAPFFCRFDTWADIVDFMRDETLNAGLTDEVLRPIFEAHAESGDHRWRTILLVIFWPGLESISWKKRGWDPDIEERWQNIVWTFLQVVCRIDISRHPDHLVQKTINNTIHRLHDEYRQIWKIKSHEIMPEGDEFDSLISGVECAEHSCQELNEEAGIKKLKTYMQEGLISEADFLLLVGTRVYGKPLVNYARECGLAYQVVKKRRQRAEASIRVYEKKSKKYVPKNKKTPPLYGVGNLNRKGGGR
jgi:hypothetical protein